MPYELDDHEEIREKALNVLGETEEPLSHEEVARELGVDSDTAGEVMSDLVVDNIVATNADWEYKKVR